MGIINDLYENIAYGKQRSFSDLALFTISISVFKIVRIASVVRADSEIFLSLRGLLRRSPNEYIEKSAYDVGEEDEKEPEKFLVIFYGFVENAINKRPKPQNAYD